MTTGHLSPPSGPPEPGGFDFQRMAWFLKLGGVGYTRSLTLAIERAERSDFALWIYNLRHDLSRYVQNALPDQIGAVASAIITGDRSAMTQDTLRDLRGSNLAHLLAISGLHMGLLTGFIYALIRYGLALIPWVALRWPIKKCAAAAAIVTGVCYLLLSGGNVATERAFVMVAVMFVAVLVGRRALTLRAVAIAAMIVLLLRPEALTGPGFQMSFAATTALVAVFQALRSVDLAWLPNWTKPVFATVMSSFVAGVATAPFAAAHFNQIAHLGLVANLLSVPLMGVLVMPAAVLAVCLAPLGLAWIGFFFMGLGLQWILFVADRVSSIDGALGHVPTPSVAVLPIFGLGALLIILWPGRLRFVGFAPCALALVLWTQTERPAVLVAESGALIGLLTDDGRALSKPRGDGFAARSWLENDGTPIPQDQAFAKLGLDQQGKVTTAMIVGVHVVQISGQTAQDAYGGCGTGDILILSVDPTRSFDCPTYGPTALRETGALGIYTDAGTVRIETASETAGARLWNTPDLRQTSRNRSRDAGRWARQDK
jgi:competence protein ComEC